MTKAQRGALRWLFARHSDGVFDRNGVLLAGGDLAPYMRATWNALRDLGFLEFYKPTGKGYGRARLTIAGQLEAALG